MLSKKLKNRSPEIPESDRDQDQSQKVTISSVDQSSMVFKRLERAFDVVEIVTVDA